MWRAKNHVICSFYLSFFLFFFLSFLKPVCCYDYWLDPDLLFFPFLFRSSKQQIPWFSLSFFSLWIFLYVKFIKKTTSEISLSVLSFFIFVYLFTYFLDMCTDTKIYKLNNMRFILLRAAWKNSVNASVGGAGMLIGPRALKTLNSIEKIQPRMVAATFNGNPKATIISCYSPTNVSEENEIVTFYEDLSSLVRSIPKHNLLVIGGDMNAQIGKNRNNKYSLHNASNRNGQQLIDFMIENRLTCLNTNFQKREGKLWTYTYANKSKAQIDYVLINRKWKNSAMNCKAYFSFEGVSSDHRIVTVKYG